MAKPSGYGVSNGLCFSSPGAAILQQQRVEAIDMKFLPDLRHQCAASAVAAKTTTPTPGKEGRQLRNFPLPSASTPICNPLQFWRQERLGFPICSVPYRTRRLLLSTALLGTPKVSCTFGFGGEGWHAVDNLGTLAVARVHWLAATFGV